MFLEYEKNNNTLTWGNSLTVPFEPGKLELSTETGRLYHPFVSPKRVEGYGELGLLKSHLALQLSEFISSDENGVWRFQWDGSSYPIKIRP